MSQEQKEARTQNMKRMLAANKVRLARNKVIQIYQHEFGYALRVDQFLDMDQSHSLLRQIYQQMRATPAKTLATVHEVRSELAHLKEACRTASSRQVILYYRNSIPVQRCDYVSAGGIQLALREVWNILEHIPEDQAGDILVVEESLASGFGIETEEYGYRLASWGLDTKFA